MSSPGSNVPPSSVVNAALGSNLHSTLLGLYFAGGYFGLYCATTIIYWSNTSPNRQLIIGSLTVLYATIVGQIVIQWYCMAMIARQATKLHMFVQYELQDIAGSGDVSVEVNIIWNLIFQNCGNIIADGLMTWRCFHVCGRSLLKISPLIFLFSSEVVLSIATIILLGVLNFLPGFVSNRATRQYDIINGSQLSVTAATSILATLIIAYQIYSLTSNSTSRKNYRYIVEIMVQSVSVYSVFMLAQAICDFATPNTFGVGNEWYFVFSFLNAAGVISSGVAPTLMVARLSMANEDRMEKSNTTNLSALQAELDNNPEEDPALTTNEIEVVARQEAESLTRSGDSVV